METLREIFGRGKDLSSMQMGCRGILIFILAFILIRLSGRRSFSMRTPLDNIITILLGAILSRAVVGASSFFGVVTVCSIIVAIHRICGWMISRNLALSKFFEGEKILLFENGRFLEDNMNRALVRKEDIMQWVRKTALTENLGLIEKIYMEKNGEISSVKKKID